jgi:opacity protein-like surface antigen
MKNVKFAVFAAALLASSAAYADRYQSLGQVSVQAAATAPEGNGHVDLAQAKPEGNGHVDIAQAKPEGKGTWTLRSPPRGEWPC